MRVKNNYIFGIPDLKLPIHYTTYGATMMIKGCLHVILTIMWFSVEKL